MSLIDSSAAAFPLQLASALAWLALLALTGLSWHLGVRAAGPAWLAAALGVTLLKAQLVIDHFMGLRHVRARWRVLLAGWLALVGTAIGAPLLMH